jgi:hypothetical protein
MCNTASISGKSKQVLISKTSNAFAGLIKSSLQ